MRYAKLIDGVIYFAPKKIKGDNSITYNPTAEMLLALGYLPVRETEAPEVEDGYYCYPIYKQGDDEIVQEWVIEELPDEMSGEEVLNALEAIL